MKGIFTTILVSSASVCFVAEVLPASAQSTAAPPPKSGLEVIIVTAQRIHKDLQKTPVAVTSFNATALKQQGVTSLLNLNALAPNVSVGTRASVGPASGDVTIRGIGIDANPPASPSVGIYIDEVYFPGSFGNLLGLFDVDRIEVLRGPQGTLFGRNTIAGAIQYVAVKPQLGKYSSFVEYTAGNLNRNDISAGLNIPIGNIAALRVSGGINDRDGYVHDQLNEVNRGSDRTSEIRVQLRIRPTDDLTIDIKGEYVRDRTNGSPTIPIGFDYLGNSPTDDALGRAYAPAGLNQYLPTSYYSFAGVDGAEFSETQFRILQSVISYQLSDKLTLKSITAASANESLVQIDQDETPILLLNVDHGNVNDRLFTQEFQLIGTFFNNRLHYQLGSYFYDDHATTTGEYGELGIKAPSPPFPPGTVFPAIEDTFGNYADATESYAAYGQATFDITHKLAIVGGLRYTSERALASDNLNPIPSASQTFTDVSPMVGLNYQATPDLLFYIKDSRGFRAGGFSPNVASYNYFGPENATTYEGGARMEFLHDRLRVNPTVFLTDWNDIQFNSTAFVRNEPFPIIENAGNARIKGAEVEIKAAVTAHFILSASGSLLDGHYTSISPQLLTQNMLGYGSGLKRAPQSAYTIAGRYDLLVLRDRLLTFSANYAWQAHQRGATTDNNNVSIPAYGILNARVDFKVTPSLTFSVFATNLAGAKYYLGGTNFSIGGIIPTISADIGPPREYGLTAREAF